jgi:hypothetical protein
MLHWNDGRIKRWESHEDKSQSQWHKTLEKSNGIIPPRSSNSEILSALSQKQAIMMHEACEIYNYLTEEANNRF